MAEFTLRDNGRLIGQPSHEIMDQVYRLRVSAWRARTNAFPDMDVWRDAYDDKALHWAIVAQESGQSDSVIASARMTIRSALSEVPNSVNRIDREVPKDKTTVVIHDNYAD